VGRVESVVDMAAAVAAALVELEKMVQIQKQEMAVTEYIL
jgi:hypothetical protein